MYARIEQFVRLLERCAELTGRIISWLTLAMVIITFAVVVLRYVFETGSIAMQESVTYLHAIVFMLCAAYTLKHDAHVRVDIFYRRWPQRTQAWIDLLGTLLLLVPVCVFIIASSLDYVSVSWSIREGSQEAGGLDGVYLLKTAIPAMAGLLLLQGLALALQKILFLAGHARAAQSDADVDRKL